MKGKSRLKKIYKTFLKRKVKFFLTILVGKPRLKMNEENPVNWNILVTGCKKSNEILKVEAIEIRIEALNFVGLRFVLFRFV